MKVAFFSFGILEQGGGFENYLLDTVSGLKRTYPEMDLTIITASDRLTKKLQSLLTVYYFKKQSVESIYRETPEIIKVKLGEVKYLKIDSLHDIKAELKNYDVIHSKNEILEFLLLAYFGIKKLPPVITGIHTPVIYPYAPSLQSKVHNLIYKVVYKAMITKIVSVYVQNAEDYELMSSKFNHPKVCLINQAIEISPDTIIKNQSKGLRILFVGRLSEQKGVDILLETISRLNKSKFSKNLIFRIVGTGDPGLIKDIEVSSIKYKNVEFLGHIAHDKVGKLYDWTDVTLIPSRYETLCKVAIETAMHGKVAIASDIPGPREVIKNESSGYLIEPNAVLFSQIVLDLYQLKNDNPDEFYTLGKTAQEHVSKTFNPAKAYKALKLMITEANVSN